jgi:ssDNA-binding Zn-finger/Zn-ribbon topoisomerase 1
MTMKRLLLVAALVLIPAMAAFAGMSYPMVCSSCGFSSRVQIGGAKKFEQMTGYCAECKKFVYVKWDRGGTKPEPIAKVWDSTSGESVEIYKCPDCSKPVIPLRASAAGKEGPGFDHCPKCGKKTFEVDKKQGIIIFD